jgi:hypothetical protein
VATTFEEFIRAERERLDGEREALWNEIKEREDKVTAINKELDAIKAYEAAKAGKPVPQPEAEGKKRKGPAPGTKRAPRGSGATARDRVLELVRQHANDGIRSKDIIEQLPDIKGHNNIISKLTKEKLIQNSGRGQPFFPRTPDTDEEAA